MTAPKHVATAELLTQESRARLLAAGVVPASRPELPDQLRSIGEAGLAQALADAAAREKPVASIVSSAGIELPAPVWTAG